MALSSEGTNTTMLVSPTGAMGNGFGFGDGNGWWIILFIIILMLGFGNNNGFGGGNNGFMPYALNTNNDVQRGFDQAAIINGINGVQTSVNGISSQLCNSFAQAEIADNARQVANMQQMFSLQSQFADCCCENRLANCQTQNIIQNEGNMTRFADANNTRDIIQSQTNGTQAILDKLCSLELDNYKRENDQLRNQLTMANLAASQTAQTAQLLADNSRQTTALEQYLNPAPIPAYVVQNPNCCAYNNGGCGCGTF